MEKISVYITATSTINEYIIHKIASSKIEKFAYHTAQVATMFWNENHDILT